MLTVNRAGLFAEDMAASAFLVMTYKGSFTAPMAFTEFPHDVQSLPFEIELLHETAMMSRRHVMLQPNCQLSPTLIASINSGSNLDTVSGWDIIDCSGVEFDNKEWDLDMSKLDPQGSFSEWAAMMSAIGNPMSEYSTSSGRFTVKAGRKASYYTLNYVMVVALLTAASWLAFFVDPTALEDRVGVALTLLLAIGVFQLILNDGK
eukprot:SAG31_NODE_259_length_18917_cov_28.559677_3_plen_205_part_00